MLRKKSSATKKYSAWSVVAFCLCLLQGKSKGRGSPPVITPLLYSRNHKIGTSETLCNETVITTENVKPISVHVPTHLRPVNDEQFGHYLAGLIDGDGHFSSKQQLVIVFHSLDASLAYYIKERLGFGSIHKVKDKNALILVIAARKGLEKVINLINGKIRTENKYDQIIKNILNHENYAEFSAQLSLLLPDLAHSGGERVLSPSPPYLPSAFVFAKAKAKEAWRTRGVLPLLPLLLQRQKQRKLGELALPFALPVAGLQARGRDKGLEKKNRQPAGSGLKLNLDKDLKNH